MPSPTTPGQLYVFDWEAYDCTPLPQQPVPKGWTTDYDPNVTHPPNQDPAYRVACAPDPVRAGTKSARFQLYNTDPPVSGATRAELKMSSTEPLGAERWYGFSIYLDNWQEDAAAAILAQWHQDDSNDPRFQGSPPLALMTKGDSWCISIRKAWDNTASPDTDDIPAGAWQQSTWTDWVFHVVWRDGDVSDAVTEVWKDGTRLHAFSDARQGKQNKFADGKGNYMRFGIYKWVWASNPPPTIERLIHFDELRIADRHGSLQAVSPPSTAAPGGCLTSLIPLLRRLGIAL